MSISAAQRKKDPHAGPGDSFPLDADHLKAAWDLAGHAANPAAVRAKVLAFARAHNMMDRLPKEAQEHAKHTTRSRRPPLRTSPGIPQHVERGDDWQHRHMVQVAHDRGLVKHLPPEAHGMLHDMGLAHEHEGMTNQTDDGIQSALAMSTWSPRHPKVGFFT